MKMFGELTREEKGELLLSHHEGKGIQFYSKLRDEWINANQPIWSDDYIYRVQPKRADGWVSVTCPNGMTTTLFGTFEVDEGGKPVVSSWIPNE